MIVKSLGQAIFAAMMIACGLAGFIEGKFAPIWTPVPAATPARELLIYLCAFVALAGGVGLLLKAAAPVAARGLFVYLGLWMLLFKAPFIIREPLQEVSYQSTGESVVWVAAAWVLAIWFSSEADKTRFAFLFGDTGLRLTRILYGLALIAFGLSHFFYVNMTTPLVPAYLPFHDAWAYITGGGYIAAGAAIISGLLARLAAVLVALQIGLITVLVWAPIVAAGNIDAGHWQETVVSCAITAGAWVMADSYRDAPWLLSPRTSARGA
ncbi:MAG: DoxX family membrane protein [Proteobacteria bacterium]|nr:DoxX family membrane protein [Pseudomonadota bacterium]